MHPATPQLPEPHRRPLSRIFLLDNGSFEPAATRRLRLLAEVFGRRIDAVVEPVSLLHSGGIPAEKLDGRPAETFASALHARMAEGTFDFTIVPLFIGPSRGILEYLPERVARQRESHPALRVLVAPPLHAEGDDRLERMLEDHVRSCRARIFPADKPVRVALVDHGSPTREVTGARDCLAKRLAVRLGDSVAEVAACSMERRPGENYAFNEPLLETLLSRPPWNRGPVIVAMLFLLPGRHAGPAGDVANICTRVSRRHPLLRTAMSPLMAEHPLLLEILVDRLITATGARFLKSVTPPVRGKPAIQNHSRTA